MPFLKYIKEQVFKPLHMNHTTPEISQRLISNRARYYYREPKGKTYLLRNSPYVDLSLKWGGGGFVSTVGDLAKFGNAVLNGYLFSKPVSIYVYI